jgi:hypothetical protein
MPQTSHQSSTNYAIESDVISGGGGECISDNYMIEHTTGQSSIGISRSDNYINQAGFWYAVASGSSGNWYGDMDVDGIVDISDVIRVLRMALALDTPVYCADINGDGAGLPNVDISDVILTLRMALDLDTLRVCSE